jgi:hypothetical protein
MDPRYYVQTYQEAPLFSDVSVEKGRQPDQLRVEMKVPPKKKAL